MSNQNQNIVVGLQIAATLLTNAQNLLALVSLAHAEGRDITDGELNSLGTADDQVKAVLESKLTAATPYDGSQAT